MRDVVIRVDGLGKRYRIPRGQNSRHGYTALRDVIMDKVKAPIRRLLSNRERSPEPDEVTIWSLRDVSLSVRAGEVVGVIGRNGAGKSTLLKILSRVTHPTEGSVQIAGRVGSLLEVGTGFHTELTGRENVYLNGAILGMKKAEIDRKFNDIISFAEVGTFVDTPVKYYSSGMYMRLAFAVAAHLDPEIMLVDEVLAVGDASFQKKCLGKMGQVGKEGRTILFVSHNLGSITALCHRAILLENGRLAADGPPAEVVSRYLRSFSELSGERCFAAQAEKRAQIGRVRVLDALGSPNDSVDLLKPIRVELEYEIRVPLSGIMVGCTLVTAEGVQLLATDDTDTDPRLLSRREPGCYETAFEIPPHLLNTGDYSLTVGICVPNAEILDRQEDAVRFSVYDSGSFNVVGGGGLRRSSSLLMRLPWEVRKKALAAGVRSEAQAEASS